MHVHNYTHSIFGQTPEAKMKVTTLIPMDYYQGCPVLPKERLISCQAVRISSKGERKICGASRLTPSLSPSKCQFFFLSQPVK